MLFTFNTALDTDCILFVGAIVEVQPYIGSESWAPALLASTTYSNRKRESRSIVYLLKLLKKYIRDWDRDFHTKPHGI